MKIVKLEIDGVNYFKDNKISISFEPQKIVRRHTPISELNEVLPDLYLGNSLVFCGEFGTGKSVILKLIKRIISDLCDEFNFEAEYLTNDYSKYNVVFLMGEYLYNFKYELDYNLKKILSFKCYFKKYLKSYYVNDYLFEFGEVFIDKYDKDLVNKLFQIEKNDSSKLINKLINKLDNNISNINSETITYNNKVEPISESRLKQYTILSCVVEALQSGGICIIDSLDLNFNYLICEEIINLFFDERINKEHATLIFSVENYELLDLFTRTDNIYYCENKEQITCNNLAIYNLRNEVSKKKFLVKKQAKLNLNEVFYETK